MAVDRRNRAVTFAAVVMAQKWKTFVAPMGRQDKDFDPDHWHLIISATQANPTVGRVPLFAAWASDEEISEALAALGARGATSAPAPGALIPTLPIPTSARRASGWRST